MSTIRGYWRLGTVAIACLTIGAAASAITSAGAATSPAAAGTVTHHRAGAPTARRLLARSVHGELVVATSTGFATITLDRGVVQSVSGQSLTLTEGTKKQAYKTVTLTIPTNAKVRDDRHQATLAEVKPGQRVMVVQAPRRTLVIARPPRTP